MSDHTTIAPLLATTENSPTISRSSTPVGELGVEMSWPSTPERERHHLLPVHPFSTSEGVGMVTSRSCNPTTSLLPNDIQHTPESRLNMTHTSNPVTPTQQATSQASVTIPAANAPPPSEPGTLFFPAAIALPASYPTSPIATTSPIRHHPRASSTSHISTSSSSYSTEKLSWPASPTSDRTPTQATKTPLPSIPLPDLVGEHIMSTLETIPFDFTLTDFLNYIIDHDIDLPTEDEIDGGDRAANATCLLPIDDRPPFDEYEAAMMEFTRANPGFAVPDGLKGIGEKDYYEDPETGLMRKRPGVVSLRCLGKRKVVATMGAGGVEAGEVEGRV
ncbi:MAG: hypothetical protein Q9224_001166, partial [Gallowayella concinna]